MGGPVFLSRNCYWSLSLFFGQKEVSREIVIEITDIPQVEAHSLSTHMQLDRCYTCVQINKACTTCASDFDKNCSLVQQRKQWQFDEDIIIYLFWYSINIIYIKYYFVFYFWKVLFKYPLNWGPFSNPRYQRYDVEEVSKRFQRGTNFDTTRCSGTTVGPTPLFLYSSFFFMKFQLNFVLWISQPNQKPAQLIHLLSSPNPNLNGCLPNFNGYSEK